LERRQRGLSLAGLARELRCDAHRLSAYERGIVRHPQPAFVAKLEAFFGYPIEQLRSPIVEAAIA